MRERMERQQAERMLEAKREGHARELEEAKNEYEMEKLEKWHAQQDREEQKRAE